MAKLRLTNTLGRGGGRTKCGQSDARQLEFKWNAALLKRLIHTDQSDRWNIFWKCSELQEKRREQQWLTNTSGGQVWMHGRLPYMKLNKHNTNIHAVLLVIYSDQCIWKKSSQARQKVRTDIITQKDVPYLNSTWNYYLCYAQTRTPSSLICGCYHHV